MSDLISRQATIDAIDKYIRSFDGIEVNYLDGLNTAIGFLNEMPPAQSEIIRCEDCDYWDVSCQNDDYPNYHYCPLADRMHRGDFYCFYAERKRGD